MVVLLPLLLPLFDLDGSATAAASCGAPVVKDGGDVWDLEFACTGFVPGTEYRVLVQVDPRARDVWLPLGLSPTEQILTGDEELRAGIVHGAVLSISERHPHGINSNLYIALAKAREPGLDGATFGTRVTATILALRPDRTVQKALETFKQKNADAFPVSDKAVKELRPLTVEAPGLWRVTLPEQPPSRIRLAFDGVGPTGDSRNLHVDVEWDPFQEAKLERTLFLEPGSYRVGVFSDTVADPSGTTPDPAWTRIDQVIATGGSGTSVYTLNVRRFDGLRPPINSLTCSVATESRAGHQPGQDGKAPAVAAAPPCHYQWHEVPIRIESIEAPTPEQAIKALRSSGTAVGEPVGGGDRSFADDVASEAFSIAAEVAVEKARSKSGALFEKKVRALCETPVIFDAVLRPASVVQGVTDTVATAFPATCSLLSGMDLSSWAANEAALVRSLSRDAASLAAEAFVHTATIPSGAHEAFADAIRELGTGDGDASFVEHRLLVALAELVDGEDGHVSGGIQVARAALALSEQCAQLTCNERMVVSIIENDASGVLSQFPKTLTSEQKAQLRRVVRLGQEVLGKQRIDSRARQRQAVKFALDVIALSDVLRSPGVDPRDEEFLLTALRIACTALLDHDMPSLGAALTDLLKASRILRDVKDPEATTSAAAKLLTLVGSVTTYARTYDDREPATDEERAARRAARKQAMESLIESSTLRTQRFGDSIFSLGVGANLFGGVDVPTHYVAAWHHAASPSLPLQLAYDIACKNEVVDSLGFHGSIYAFDLGQYVAVASGDTQPRWDTAVAIGGQAAATFFGPELPVAVGIDLRWAPTLSSTKDADVFDSSGGTARAGVFVGIYVPFFDFN